MGKRETITALCRRHHNEDVHTEHVTALALQIFDGVAAHAGLAESSRALLQTAAQLHDIGYAHAPMDHLRAGAGIIQRSRLRDVTRAESRLAAAVMTLHSARWEEYARRGKLRGAAERGTVMKLGAILRVADALDHGHIQNTEIVSITRRGRTVVLRARAPGFAANIDRARAKSDLWQRVMPQALEVRRVAVAKPKTPYAHVLAPDLTALEVARRLLFFYYRSVTKHATLARVEDDPIHLHDIRVGVRRFRSVLRLFRTELAPTSAEYINGRLRTLGVRLGPLRDADAWTELLESEHVERRARRDARWKPYVAQHRQAVARNLRRLRAILSGATYRESALRMAVLLRTEIPELIRRQKSRPARKVLAGRLWRIVRRVAELGIFRKSLDAETMHELRILCRRGRYWTEFAAPVLGPKTVELAKRLKGIADALGHLHDLDVAIDRLKDDATAPAVMRGVLRQARQHALHEASRAWRRLHHRKLLEQAMKELE